MNVVRISSVALLIFGMMVLAVGIGTLYYGDLLNGILLLIFAASVVLNGLILWWLKDNNIRLFKHEEKDKERSSLD